MRNEFVEERKTPTRALPAGHWHIELLGGFSARNGDVQIGRFPGRAERLLLVTLALQPGRAWRREALIDRLWPEATLPRGRARLRTVLANLRTLLELPGMRAGSVVGDAEDTVWLEADAVRCDVAEFEARVREYSPAAALALYRGELLPLVTDDWVAAERRRLQALYERAGGAVEADADAATDVGYAEPPAAIDVGPRVLPRYRSRFIGREAELQRMASAAGGERLLTLTGAGGCGKTRLAVEAARRLATETTVVLVALSECHEGGLLHEHVRAARGLQAGATSTLDQVVADLEDRPALLVLDNFEPLVTPAGLAAVWALLQRLPRARVWVTSRQPLGLPGEQVLALAPLPLPAANAGPAAALRAPSTQLFVDRARQARADFALHGRNVGAVVTLCRLLDGLPLALELAASRVRDLPPEAMCRELEAGHAPLRHGAGRRSEGRHASLARLIEWSWRLLPQPQQDVLAVMTVFRGGATAAQAAAVSGLSFDDAQERLAGLVRASLLVSTAAAQGDARYELLLSVAEGLRSLAAPAPAVVQAHRQCFASVARQGARQRRPLDDADLANVVQAFGSAVAGDRPLAVRMALDLLDHWRAAGITPSAMDAQQALAAALAEPQGEAVELLARLGPLWVVHGQGAAGLALVERALAAAGADPALRAQALLARVQARGRSLQWAADLEADAEAARLHAGLAGRPDLAARALRECAEVWRRSPDRASAAEAAFVDARDQLAALGDGAGVLEAKTGRLACCIDQGRYAEVISAMPALLDQAAALRHVSLELALLNRQGVALEGLRRWRQAVEVYRRMVHTARRHGLAYHAAFGLWNQCAPLLKLRRPADAMRLLAFSVGYCTQRVGPLSKSDHQYVAEARALATRQLGARGVDAAWHDGERLSLADGLALGGG